MITAKLQQILTDCGCSLLLYESDKLANLLTDQSNQYDIIGLVLQVNDMTLSGKANATTQRYKQTIEIMKQVRLEDTAANNEATLESLVNVCVCIRKELIALAIFKQIGDIELTKILETKYDANVLGWSMALDLTYLNNEPCIITSP
jgi:chaperone required for assembly of F1-ATPase